MFVFYLRNDNRIQNNKNNMIAKILIAKSKVRLQKGN